MSSTAARNRVAKRALYAKHGGGHCWLVDPVARTLEALVLRDGAWVDGGAWDPTASARIPPFEEVELEIERLFLPETEDPNR